MSNRKEEFLDFVEKAKQLLIDGKEEILKSSKIGRVLLEISSYNRERNQLFKELGKMLYEVDSSQINLPDDFKELLSKVDNLKKEIEDREKKIDDLRYPEKSDESEKTDEAEKPKEE